MAGKSHGPKLHVAGKSKDGGDMHQHHWYSRGEDVIDALLESDFLDPLIDSGLFGDDSGVELETHRIATDSEGYARLAIGSPHGGPVFILRVAEADGSTAESIRHCLLAEHTECYAGEE